MQFYPDPRAGYAVQWWPASVTDQNARPFTVNGQPVSGIDATLNTGFSVSGKFTVGGSPAVRGQICPSIDGRYVGGASTDGAGNYLWRLTNGSYRLEFYSTLRCDGNPDAARLITVSGQDLVVNVDLP